MKEIQMETTTVNQGVFMDSGKCDLSTFNQLFQFLKTRLKAKNPQNKQKVIMAAVQARLSTTGKIQLLMSVDHNLRTVIDSKNLITSIKCDDFI